MPTRPRIPGLVPVAPGIGRTRPARPTEDPSPPPARGRGSRARYALAIKKLVGRVRNLEAEFYAIGTELRALDRAEVIAAFGHPNFRDFVEAEVMPYHQAYRYMVIAGAYPKRLAMSLGVEKGFHLVQYAEIANTTLTARVLAERDSRLGSARMRVSELSALEIQNLVRVARLGAARAAKPKASARETRAARELGRKFEERFGLDARVRVDKARDVVRIEVKLSEWLETE